MDAKISFLSDKELSEWLRAIVSDNRFKKCLAFANAEFLEAETLNGDNMAGAKKFQRILIDLAEIPPDVDFSYPKSGLHHNLDIKPRTKKTDKEPTKKA